MTSETKTIITIENTIEAPVKKVWECWTKPQEIIKWNNASEDWHTPRAENDLRTGGRFNFRMEARDGTMGFDFYGIYDQVRENEYLEYTIGDGRKVNISFVPLDEKATRIIENFEAESTHPVEMQKNGWQSILDNFKKTVEQG